ncbi:MAG: hypothetical protein HY810_07510 [Candidatus Omnitrophica bacterium]|nr:hypothetical protein [Candidatus Omnitrophota bacterium]
MKLNLNALFVIGKAAYFIVMLLVFNFFFGLLFLPFLYWLAVGGVLLGALFLAGLMGKKVFFSPFKGAQAQWQNKNSKGRGRKNVVDVEAEVFEDDNSQEDDVLGVEWKDPVYCPLCDSNDTRFVEPRYERAVYECNNCRKRFEIEE